MQYTLIDDACSVLPPTARETLTLSSHAAPQIKDLNSGTFGFVQLALDKTTGRQVALKFIERGDKVSSLAALVSVPRSPPSPARA